MQCVRLGGPDLGDPSGQPRTRAPGPDGPTYAGPSLAAPPKRLGYAARLGASAYAAARPTRGPAELYRLPGPPLYRIRPMRTYIRIGLLAAMLAAAYFCQATVAVAATAPLSHVSVLTGDQVVQILDETVDWYRTLGAQQQSATQPSDLLILYANQQTADKVIGLAFEIARANAELLSSEASNADTVADATSSAQALSEQQKRLDAQRKAIEDEIAADRKLVAGGKTELAAKLLELQGELDMVSARKNLLDTMSQFVNESDAKRASASALKAHIDAIAVSIPSANLGGAGPVTAAAPGTPGSAASPPATGPMAASLSSTSNSSSDRTGIWELGSNVLRLSKKMSTIDGIDARTAALEQTFVKIRTPPLEQLKGYAAQSDALAVQADNANGVILKGVRDQFDTLAWLFKQTSAILIPLSKEGVLLKQYRHNLSNWRDTIKHQYHDALAALGVRLAVLATMLAVVFAGAEVWRRAVLRYAHEPRRRNQ
jgi:hypothetical protein